MRLYSAESLEALRARRLLKEWAADRLLSEEQHRKVEQETVCDLRTTNIFLRGVLFFFTLIVVGAATGLLFVLFLERAQPAETGMALLVLALLSYAAAELAVAQAHLYRHGIEEALAVCSVVFLYFGLEARQGSYSSKNPAMSLVPLACAAVSLWIWHRFGHWSMLLAAMMLAASAVDYWTSLPAARHAIIAAIYLAGLIGVIASSSRHRFDYLHNGYSVAEALLWGGVYLTINLKLSGSMLPVDWRPRGLMTPASAFPPAFYWSTWVLTWCMPLIVMARGLRRRDRFVLGIGLVSAILTFVTNKPYLGWERHTWDPMLLGVFLTGAVLWIQRWMARGAGGVREGFTAARISGREKSWVDAGSGALGFITPHSITPGAQAHDNGPSQGGMSGGGGATREF